MNLEYSLQNKEYVRRAIEVSIHVGLMVLLTAACLMIVRPFLPLVAWGIYYCDCRLPCVPTAAEFGGRAWKPGRCSFHSAFPGDPDCAAGEHDISTSVPVIPY
jgi:hypothetical protein